MSGAGRTDTSGAAVRTVQVRIDGRVQGVGFRAWTMTEAHARGLSGWVRNRGDGSVEALFSGAEDAVENMLDACWLGPPAARVRSVTPRPADPPLQRGFHGLATL